MPMKTSIHLAHSARVVSILIVLLGAAATMHGQQPAKPEAAEFDVSDAALRADVGGVRTEPSTSIEQGQTPLVESFEFDRRQWRLKERREALKDTQFKINFRTFYLDREKFDGSEI